MSAPNSQRHADCEDRCQLLEHKGYHSCSQTGVCAYMSDENHPSMGGPSPTILPKRIEQLRDLAQNKNVDTCLVQEWEAVAIYDLALSALRSETGTPKWFLQTVAGEAFTREELRAEAKAMLVKNAAPQASQETANLAGALGPVGAATPNGNAASILTHYWPRIRSALFHGTPENNSLLIEIDEVLRADQRNAP